MYFTGRESLKEIKEKFEAELAKNSIAAEKDHKTTRFAGVLAKMPNWLYKFVLAVLRFGDKHGMLPRKLLDVSPFHTSIFITDLRSIKLNSLYHHLYNFGNTTIFAAMGKLYYAPVANRSGEISVAKQCDMRFTLDERVCDGLYYGNSLRVLMKNLENPELMLESLPEPELEGKALKKKQKHDKKQAKKGKKQAKREEKKAKKNK